MPLTPWSIRWIPAPSWSTTTLETDTRTWIILDLESSWKFIAFHCGPQLGTFHGLSTHAMANTTLESQYPVAPAFAAGCLWGGWSLEVSSGIHPKGATSTRKSATASAYHLCLRWVNWTLMAFVWAVSGNKIDQKSISRAGIDPNPRVPQKWLAIY